MLTPEQEDWINQMPDDKHIEIFPYDPNSEAIFENLCVNLERQLVDLRPEHHGATSFKISGQNEIDTYIPVPPEQFDTTVSRLTDILGHPASIHPNERARFSQKIGGKRVDVFLVNQEHQNWKDLLRFEEYLRSHSEALDTYRKLKEDGAGLSIREYFRRKTEFINDILEAE